MFSHVFNGLSRGQLAVLTVLLVVATAGCLGFGPSDDGSDAGEDATELASAIAEELATVEAFEAEITATDEAAGNVAQTSEQEVTIRVDREGEVAVLEQRVRTQGETVESDIYLYNGAIYERSDVYAQQFGSEWVRNDNHDAFTAQWLSHDFPGEIQAFLAHGTVELNGTETVEGTETTRLEVDGDEETLQEQYYEDLADVTYERLELTLWVDEETNKPVRVAGVVETETTVQGQTIETSQEYEYTMTYTAVDVTLPDGAADAVDVEDL